METNHNLYSVIIPVYNSEKIVEKTIQKTVDFFVTQGLRYEIVLVNDNSSDQSWNVIKKAALNHRDVVAVNLLKNYGQHSAVYCGIKMSSGDFIITMDDDLQNPPEEIAHLIRKINEGYDAVFGKFRKKQHDGIRRAGSRFVGLLNDKIFDKPKDLILSNFRIFRRDVAERMLSHRTNFPYIPGLVLLYASRMANVAVDHHARSSGKSNYSAFKIISLLARILFNYSSYPLRFLSIVGFFIAAVSFALGVGYVAKGIIVGATVPGWTTIVVLTSFLNGFVIMLLGMVGEYITRLINLNSVVAPYQIQEIARS